jgi:drug/metabolite transporter (DMT)-like permease
MGLAGTALILLRGAEGGFGGGSFIGYGAAILCALTWSGYSLLSRQFGETPTDVITGFCLLTAVLSLLCHLALETTVWPVNAVQWLAILGLGLGTCRDRHSMLGTMA